MHSTTSGAGKKIAGRRRRPLSWLLKGITVAGLLVGLHGYQTRGVVSGPAPEFQGRLLDGTPVSLSAFRGRPLLLHFWATWCPICDLEHNSINRIAEDHAVLSVAMDDVGGEQLQQSLGEKGVSYAVLPDPAGRIAARFGVRGVPTGVIIDAAGRIRFVTVGYTSEAGLRLRLWWVAS